MINVDKILAVVYRVKNNRAEFLCLKRPIKRGGWWQFVTGNIERGEVEKEAVFRELIEETTINEIENLIDMGKVYQYQSLTGDIRNEKLFVIKIPEISKIRISSEHDEFAWCSYQKTQGFLQFDNNKDALALAYTKILETDDSIKLTKNLRLRSNKTFNLLAPA